MRDGMTRKKAAQCGPDRGTLRSFLARRRATLVAVSGPRAGTEILLDGEQMIIGRGPGVGIRVDDPEVSRQHACLEFHGSGYRLRDLGSTNGVRLDGTPIQVAELHPGDRFEVGGHAFQYVVVETEPEPEVYDLSGEV
jgi:pSer/pThr/pTyr-binding forkhead associated (FHA) protein